MSYLLRMLRLFSDESLACFIEASYHLRFASLSLLPSHDAPVAVASPSQAWDRDSK